MNKSSPQIIKKNGKMILLVFWTGGTYYYDAVAGGRTGNTFSFETYQDPWQTSSATSRRPTIYATYTASGGGGEVPITSDIIMFD